MRWVFVMLAVAACGGKKEAPKQDQPAAAPVVLGSGSAAPDAASGPVELLHAYIGFVEVSSHVMNKTIKPEHLVDRDLETAWNSRTGELVGAWLDVSVPGGAIEELRLTVGHTGTGPKGEDYFAMNPRIKAVSLLDGETVLAKVTLDPEKRALQTIKLPAPIARVRIRVDEIVPGSKKSWREVCISELEAWGKPPPDATPSKRVPVVSVFVPPQPTLAELVNGKAVDPNALCDKLMKPLQVEWEGKDHGLEDAPPSCGVEDSETLADGGPWKSVGRWQLAYNDAHGPKECTLVVSTELGDFFVGPDRSCGPWDDENLRVRDVRVEDATPGGDPELVIEYLTLRADVPIEMIVCRIANSAVQCTAPFVIEGPTWKVKPRFVKGTIAFDPAFGKPPPEVSGPQPLAYGS
jgi:hypothetical protein